jgi:uncharacterized protein YndB with AHSA1/START domain
MNQSNGRWLRMARLFPSPRAAVWTAIADARELRRWWGPKGFSVPELEFSPQPGGGFRMAMQPPEGETFHLEGEFREVHPPSLLSFTFRWDPPDPDDRETVVTLAVRDRGARTEVELTQGEFATEERLALHEDGWTESFEKLEALLV